MAITQRSWRVWLSGLALVRFLVLGFLTMAVYAGVQILGTLAVKLTPAPYKDWVWVGAALAGGIAMLQIYRQLIAFFERRRADEADFSLPLLLLGSVLGALLFCILYAIYFELGDAIYAGYAGVDGVPKFLAIGIVSGICEEVIFRGVLFRIAEEAAGTLVALIVSGLIFGLLHLGNPHATWFSSTAIAIEAGVMLGAAYALTRNLWLPIGLHFAWNFTEGGVFGAGLSGMKTQGILRVPLHGPGLITGGAFGPEASVVAVGAGSLLTLIFLFFIFRRGEWVPLHWSWR